MKQRFMPSGKTKFVLLLISTLISITYFSCRKQSETPVPDVNSPSVKFDFSGLRSEMRVNTKDVLAWVEQNISAEDQKDLLLSNLEQRFIDNHHVVKIPFKNKDHVALFFTKDNGQLKAFLYNWQDKAPGEKYFNGNIMSYSFQDQNIRGMKYAQGKRTKLAGLDTKKVIANTKTTQSVTGSNGNPKKVEGIFADIWCILTGGDVIYGATNGCFYGAGGWLNDVISYLSSIFGHASDGGSYGSDPSAPVGVWYGPESHNSGTPSEADPSPASQPYEGGPVWISQWVDTTNLNNCGTIDENGMQVFLLEGCSSGYWESVEISDSFYDNQDTFSGNEDENDVVNDSSNQPKSHIPAQISLNNGKIVQIIFGSTADGSADQMVNTRLIDMLTQALNIASNSVTINSIYIKATTNGGHSSPASNHFQARY